MRNLNDWLKLIEQFHPSEIELGLTRVKQIADKLGLLTPTAKVILVGGTNGKGSCVATLESLAKQSQLTVGCYTSPHLIHFNERIRVNGANIDDESLIEAFEAIEKIREQVALTFFEFTTLTALHCFSKLNLDLLVLEIGLGGRLDAVNIVEPDVSVITTIDRDHESWLGSDLISIAQEKSGIYRKTSLNLIGDRRSQELIKQVALGSIALPVLVKEYIGNELPKLQIEAMLADPKINPHRLLKQNVECAIVAFHKLFPELIESLDLQKVLSNIQITGRLQQISDSPLTLLDVGHNEQSAINLAKQLNSFIKPKLRIAICGLMADKAIAKFLAALDSCVDIWLFVDLPGDRAASGLQIQSIHQSISSQSRSEIADSVAGAYQAALAIDEPDKQILVIGSFITVAEMLHYYRET